MNAQTTTKLDKYGINTVAKQILSPVILAAIMFALAGTTDWLWGWVFNIVHFAAWTGMTLAMLRANPELLNVRGGAISPARKSGIGFSYPSTVSTGFCSSSRARWTSVTL
jgi:hypothetical protein